MRPLLNRHGKAHQSYSLLVCQIPVAFKLPSYSQIKEAIDFQLKPLNCSLHIKKVVKEHFMQDSKAGKNAAGEL